MDDQIAPVGYLTARDTQRALGITPGALRNLVYRGRLKRAGGTDRHPWYAVQDVATISAQRRAQAAA